MKKIFLLILLLSLHIYFIKGQTITVTSPNGGENWIGCTAQNITWNYTGSFANVKIEASFNGGINWMTIVNGAANSGTYSWQLLNIPSSSCLVKVSDYNNNSIKDSSNAVFTITGNTSINIASPNGGEIWQTGGPSQNINWTATGVSEYYSLYYSIDGGTVWNTIINNVYLPSHSYNWTIPNAPSSNCLIRVCDYNNTCFLDMSNSQFTISSSGACSASYIMYPDTSVAHHYWVVSNVSGTGPLRYLWNWGDGNYDTIAYPSHTYSDTGYYQICLTIADSVLCSSDYCDSQHVLFPATMASITVIPIFVTGINKNEPLSIYKISPNPNNGTFTLSYNAQFSTPNSQLSIKDILGREVYHQTLPTTNYHNLTTIDVSNLNNGVYFYSLTPTLSNGEGETLRGKFVVEK